jgi:hypothetical protein
MIMGSIKKRPPRLLDLLGLVIFVSSIANALLILSWKVLVTRQSVLDISAKYLNNFKRLSTILIQGFFMARSRQLLRYFYFLSVRMLDSLLFPLFFPCNLHSIKTSKPANERPYPADKQIPLINILYTNQIYLSEPKPTQEPYPNL